MLKQLSDKLKQVFYQGSELKNMIETLQSFRRLAAEEEQQLKENDGKINLKEIFTQLKKGQRMFIFIFCFMPFFLHDSYTIDLQIVTLDPNISVLM